MATSICVALWALVVGQAVAVAVNYSMARHYKQADLKNEDWRDRERVQYVNTIGEYRREIERLRAQLPPWPVEPTPAAPQQ